LYILYILKDKREFNIAFRNELVNLLGQERFDQGPIERYLLGEYAVQYQANKGKNNYYYLRNSS